MEVWRKGLKGSYRLGISIGRHRYQMLFAANIDPRSVGVNQRQAFKMNSLVALFFFLRIAFDCFNKWGRLGPAAESVY